MRQESKHFFFCKKRSKKTFIHLSLTLRQVPSQTNESFLVLFFKKEHTCFGLPT